MYVRTRQRFRQVGVLYGQLSGSLGDDDLQQRIANAIKATRSLPDLLVDISVNPFPKNNGLLIDFVLMNNLSDHKDEVITQLTRVHDELYKTDPAYRQRADNEWKLRSELRTATHAVDPRRIKPFLLDALVPPLFVNIGGELQPVRDVRGVVDAFAKAMLPRQLAQRLERSTVAYSQRINLGSTLQSIAQVYLSSGKDPAFNRQVDAARKRLLDAQKRQKEQTRRQEKLRQQRLRQQQRKPKPSPPKRKMTLKDI